MTYTQQEDLTSDQVYGRDAITSDGEQLGSVDDIYFDEHSGRNEWVAVKGGFLGMRKRFAPLHGARLVDDDLVLAYTRDQIEQADFDEDQFEDEDREQALFGHYGLDYPGRSFGGQDESRDTAPGEDSMVRHEEELQVGKREVPTGHVRLRKWVETQPASEDVTLRHETARVEREPINEVVEDATLGEDEMEVSLHEEQAVVSKETVARERVSIDKNERQETETVNEQLRSEQVDVEDDSDRPSTH